MTDPQESDELLAKLNRETAKIPWEELQRFYAQGAVLEVSPKLDLVAVAAGMANDDTQTISPLLTSGQLGRVDTESAQKWTQEQASLWAVVVAPWVLVQTHRDLD